MKFKAALKKILTNKMVLNIVCLIALLNIIGFIVLGELNSVLYFVVFAILTRYFSKNMIIVLGIPIILVNLMSSKKLMEGMENNNKQDDNSKNTSSENKEVKNTNKNNNTQNKKSSQGLPITPLDQPTHDTTENNETNMDESFEVGRAKKRNGYEIDYASTIEDAYDSLNQILGSDGVKRLTDDTQNLMKQQLQLAESMKSMEPFIKNMGPMMQQAQEMLKGMGDNKQGFGNIMEMAKKLTGNTKQ
jgi:uncharacterized membrane protein